MASAPAGADLKSLLAAEHVAVIGASERAFTGTIVQRNMRAAGFSGRVSQVHPRYRAVDGAPCVARLADLDERPEVVVALTAPGSVPGVLEEAEVLGVPWAIVPAGGQMEDARHSAALAAFLAGEDRRIRVLGPNCMGLLCPGTGLSPYIGSLASPPRHGRTALISQSGGVVEAFATQGHRIGYRLLISTGNEALLSTEDVLEFLLDEGEVRTVLLWLEGVKEPARLLALLARAADQGVRVGVSKTGRSAISRESAKTHTGSFCGNWDLWTEVLRRQGANVVETLDELHELGVLLDARRPPVSPRIWATTNSGGQGAQMVDGLVGAKHLDFPEPSAECLAAFRCRFPAAGRPANPVDLWGLAEPEVAYREGTRIVVDHGGGGTLLAAIDASRWQGEHEGELAARAVTESVAATAEHEGWRTVHVTHLGSDPHPLLARALERTSCPSVRGSAGMRALAACVAPTGPRLELELPEADRSAAEAGNGWIANEGAVALLAAAGVPVLPTAFAYSPEEAAAAAAELRDPLVVKAVGPAHRGAVGGVKIGVRRSEVAEVCAGLGEIPGCIGFEVTEYAAGDLELLVQVGVDRQLGPSASLAVGGCLTEIASGFVCDLAPRTAAEARRLLDRLIADAAIDANAGSRWADHLCEAIAALAGLVWRGEASEIEVNPFLVNRSMGQVHAVDALVRAAPTG